MDKHYHIADLIVRKIKDELSLEDQIILQSWLDEDKKNADLFTKLADNKEILTKYEVYQLFDIEKSWSLMERELFKPQAIQFDTYKLLKYAASIALPILVLASITYYFLIFSVQIPLSKIDEYVKPGEQKATLVLSDGLKLDLQKEDIQKEIEGGKAEIVNQNSSVTYNTKKITGSHQALVYNKLITPKGGKYNVTLADGTVVALNAASSLKFPVAFTDSIRQVFLVGEAFFDVKHNGKPFIVNTTNMDIEVLGTSFDVFAYPEELDTKITLVEGSINLSTLYTDKILVPNEQAIISREARSVTVQKVNTDLYTSWINGKIEFSNDNLDVVMRKLARWYDFSYSFENEKARDFHFSARIEATQKISTILEMLQMTTEVKLEVEENEVIIL